MPRPLSRCLLIGGLVLAGAATPLATARPDTNPRAVQFRTVDFAEAVIELHNFGNVDCPLDGWRFCSHDTNQFIQYTLADALNGVVVEAGTSIFVHMNNDAPMGNPDRFNRNALGNFALPWDPDAYSLQIFRPNESGVVVFPDSTLIVDFLQWNVPGEPVGMSETRTGQAVKQLLWTAVGDFIDTTPDTLRIELNDLSGDEIGSPKEYDVINSGCPGDFNGDNEVGIVDLLALLAGWGPCVTCPEDFNGDFMIGIEDLLTLLPLFGPCP